MTSTLSVEVGEVKLEHGLQIKVSQLRAEIDYRTKRRRLSRSSKDKNRLKGLRIGVDID